MARVNIDILGINDLRWTGMGEFNSDDHCIYYCGQESLRRNGLALIVNSLAHTSLGTRLSLFQRVSNHVSPVWKRVFPEVNFL